MAEMTYRRMCVDAFFNPVKDEIDRDCEGA